MTVDIFFVAMKRAARFVQTALQTLMPNIQAIFNALISEIIVTKMI